MEADMEISVREGNVGSRVKKPKTPVKRKLRKEAKYVDKDTDLLAFKRPCKHDTPSFKCNTVTIGDIKHIRKKFYDVPDKTVQDMKLCHMMGVCETRKHQENERPKKRSIKVSYFLQSKEKKAIKVCGIFFRTVLGIGNTRVNSVANTIHSGNVPKEVRGGDHVSKKSEDKKKEIRKFIGSLKGTESHYNRKKSVRIYLPANQSISKLHKFYNTNQPPHLQSSLSMFSRIFCGEFNIGFQSPASDCCAVCVRLKHDIRRETDSRKKPDLMIERRIHKMRADAFYKLAKEDPPNSLTFCFDMQQGQPLPRTPISDAFYAHQVSFYVFCCVPMSSRHPTFYTWTEEQAGRGSVKIGLALLNYIDSLKLDNIEVLRLFCDGCGGQNKNSHIVHALYYWLKNRSPAHLKEIHLTFPVRGHSFLPADRVFGSVEKALRANTTLIKKEEYCAIYSEFGTVRQLGLDWRIYDIKSLQHCLKKVPGISDIKRIIIQKSQKKKEKVVKVQCHKYFKTVLPDEQPRQIQKSRMYVPKELDEIQLNRALPEKKKKSLQHLLAQQFGSSWKDDETLEWYRQLLIENEVDPNVNQGDPDIEDGQEDPAMGINQGENDEICDCLEEDTGMHI